MTIQKIGNIAGLEESPGTKIRFDRDGTVTVSAQYTADKANALTLAPKPGDSYPGIGGAKCSYVELENIGTELTKITAEWKSVSELVSGSISIGSDEGFYTLSSVAYESSLATHPDAEYIQSVADSLAGVTGEGWVLDENGIFQGISNKAEHLQGITNYKTGSLSWTRRWSSGAKLPKRYIDKLFKIDKPDGNPPTLESPRNWILDNIQSEQNGDGWSHSATWVSSGVGAKYVEEIYE
jgi:hypothetical protein